MAVLQTRTYTALIDKTLVINHLSIFIAEFGRDSRMQQFEAKDAAKLVMSTPCCCLRGSQKTKLWFPARMSQSGTERPLAMDVRARLFSIAHNALTNAFVHARPGRARGQARLRAMRSENFKKPSLARSS